MSIRIIRVDTGIAHRAHQSSINATELTISPGVMIVKGELVSDDSNAHRISLLNLVELIRPLPPEREGKTKKKDGLDNDNTNLKVAGNVISNAVVTRLGVFAGTELPKTDEKKEGPAQKEGEHKPVNDVDQVVNIATVISVVLGDTEPFGPVE